MKGEHLERGPLRLLVLSAVVLLLPVCGVAWLGWRVLGQDRLTVRQRQLERCETTADSAVAESMRRILELEKATRDFEHGGGGEGAAFLLAVGGRLARAGGVKLPFYPSSPPEIPLPAGIFAQPERLEFIENKPEEAAGIYAKLAESNIPGVRAQSLMRLARAWRRAGHPPEALAAYARLAREGQTGIGGEPAEMLAWYGMADTYEGLQDRAALQKHAAQLEAALGNRRWLLTRTSFDWMREQCRRWLNRALEADVALAEAAVIAWDHPGASRELVWAADRPFLVMRASGGALAVTEARSLLPAPPPGLRVTVEDAAGRLLSGARALGGIHAIRTASSSGLPWTVSVGAQAQPDGLSPQSKLVLAVLALMILFTLAGGCVAARLVSKELAVARLQSDFVSAVSHEFRSPVTSLMQLSEMLVRGRVSSDERRGKFYETMLTESQRLNRLVESLLNFGRLESGHYEYRFELLELGTFAAALADGFQSDAARQGHVVQFQWDGTAVPVNADREALKSVVWNLLDNAVKYSPGRDTVWLEVQRLESQAVLAVRDEGIGIAAEERAEIFGKFVRGAEARRRSIQGTGIGLAFANTVIAAHGGRIEVESTPGAGSTFRVWLPLNGGIDGENSRG